VVFQRTFWPHAAVAVLGALAAACGSRVIDPSGSGGDGGSSASNGSTSGAGGGPCDAFADAPSPGSVTVRFVNDSFADVYLPASCSGPDFTLRPNAGPDGVTYAFDGSCLQTCGDLRTQPPVLCGACPPASYKIPHGGSHEVTWNGTGIRSQEMPAACWASNDGGRTCSQVVAAPAGTYRVEAMGFGSCGDGEPCACDSEGYCGGNATGLEAYAEGTTFDFPTGTVVEVLFGVCAFGCGDR
jgi:hypothetical protein